MTESLDFEQRHRLESEVLPAVIDDPEYAAAQIIRLEQRNREQKDNLDFMSVIQEDLEAKCRELEAALQRQYDKIEQAGNKLAELSQENQRLKEELAEAMASLNCNHMFCYFGDQPFRRCVKCGVIERQAAEGAS